jgi:drug/metabolite transporter (DMT)-like permease
MIGSIFALLSAMSFSLNKVILRRAVLNVSDASLGTLISVPLGIPLFFLILALSGQIPAALSFSWQGYLWLSLAGVLHFVVGRSFNYNCVQLVGANITNILSRADIPVSVVIGISILKEPLSWQLTFGVLLILFGIILAGLNTQLLQTSYGRLTRIPFKAFIFGFGCGVSWGIAPIFVKLGLKNSGTPTAGIFISYVAATIFLGISLLNQKRRGAITHMSGKAAGLFFVAGFLSCIANLLRYTALALAPASVVTPLVAITPIFGLFFAFIFNRKIEIFSRPVIIGTITVVMGTIFLL